MADDTKKMSVAETLAANKLGTPSESVDNLSRTTAVGSLSTAIGDTFYGINHRQTPNAVQINKDFYGLTLFTRPRMNLSTVNIRTVRQLAPLLTLEKESIQRIIRCLLDCTLSRAGIDTPFVDNQQAFIPVLTNNLLSMSGWHDVTLPIATSQAGLYKEEFSYGDGVTADYSAYDITASFRNISGDPITALFLIWTHYISNVYQGTMVPYPEFIVENEIDYMTRIYRLVLDSTKTYVKKIGACGAAFPINSPIGASFNFEHSKPINDSNDQISITFRCMGAMYQDDILIHEFNKTTELFNDTLAADRFTMRRLKDPNTNQNYVESTHPNYTKVPIDALPIFNNRGYPRINPVTYELEWWVTNEEYNERLPLYQTQLPNTLKGQKNG